MSVAAAVDEEVKEYESFKLKGRDSWFLCKTRRSEKFMTVAFLGMFSMIGRNDFLYRCGHRFLNLHIVYNSGVDYSKGE